MLSKTKTLQESKLVLHYLEANCPYELIKELLSLKSNALEDYVTDVSKQMNIDVTYLSHHFTQKQCLKYLIDSVTFKQSFISSIIKELRYPWILLTLAYGLMVVFLFVLFPALNRLMSLFDLQTTLVVITQSLVWILFIVLSIIIFIVLIGIVWLLNTQNQKIVISKWGNTKLLSIIKLVLSYQFAFFYSLLLSFGYSTKQTLEILRYSHISYFITWFSTEMIYALEEGQTFTQSFNETLIDKELILFIQLGSHTQQSTNTISKYLEITYHKIFNYIKKAGVVTKGLSYLLIALLVILLYQILLAPMTMLNNF